MPAESFTRDGIEERLKAALDQLLKCDIYLLKQDINERAISHGWPYIYKTNLEIGMLIASTTAVAMIILKL